MIFQTGVHVFGTAGTHNITNSDCFLKLNMTRKFVLMEKINLSVLISNFNIKLSKPYLFSRFSHLKIYFLLKKCPGIWVESFCDVKLCGIVEYAIVAAKRNYVCAFMKYKWPFTTFTKDKNY